MSAESTISLGQKINIFPPIVAHVGLKEPPAQSLIGSTSPEIEPGLTLLFRPKSLSTVKLEEVAMEVIQEAFISMPKNTESLKKAARTILPKTLSISVAQIFRNVKIVLIPKEPNLEIKEIAGPHLVTLFGKSTSMAQFRELTI